MKREGSKNIQLKRIHFGKTDYIYNTGHELNRKINERGTSESIYIKKRKN